MSALNAGTILAFSEEHEKAVRPLLLMIVVPVILYGLGAAWERLRGRRKP